MTFPMSPTGQPKPEDIEASYGFVGALAKSVPELRGLIERATREQWTTDRFLMQVANTGWYKTNSATVREWITLEATDPAELKRRWDHEAGNVYYLGQRLGIELTWEQAREASMFKIHAGSMDEKNFESWLSNKYFDASKTDWGQLSGEAAKLGQQIWELGTKWGNLTPKENQDALNSIMRGTDTIEGFQQRLQNQALIKYPHLADYFKMGLSPQDIAKPYRESYATILELGAPETVMWDDKLVQKALAAPGADGKPTLQPVHEFEKSLRSDPRWGKTNNAKEQMADFITKLGEDFGYLA